MLGKPLDRPRTRWMALLTLGLLAVGVMGLLRVATAIETQNKYRNFDLSDARFYERVAASVEAGEGFYDAADRELHAGGFERSSTFNWRTPLYAHVLGKFPNSVARQAALGGLSALTAALAGGLIAGRLGRGWGVVVGLVVFASSAWWLQSEPPWFTETWVGHLILLAIVARSLGWSRLSLAAGACALFLRELALPFVFCRLVDALVRRHWREALGWSLCLTLYGIYFLIHESQVAAHQFAERFHPPTDRANWVAWNGLSFVLATTRMNYPLSCLPVWCVAIYLPLAIFGLVSLAAADRTCRFSWLGVVGSLAGFLVVGQEFNFYWGWITAPSLALGFAVAVAWLANSTPSLAPPEPTDPR